MKLPKTTERVSISLPQYLVDLADRRSHRTDESRSAIVARALRAYLIMGYADSPEFWTLLYNENSGAVLPQNDTAPA